MDQRTEIVSMKLEDGSIVKVRASALRGSEDVMDLKKILQFSEVAETIENTARTVLSTIEKVGPNKASVEFGVEVSIESSGVTALLANGSGKGNLKIILKWARANTNTKGE